MHLRCGEILNDQLCCRFSVECAGVRILKSSLYI